MRHYEMQLKYLSPASRIREKKTYCMQLEERMQDRMQAVLNRKRHILALYVEKMKGLSPLEKLSSGFSYVENETGKTVKAIEDVKEGDLLTVQVTNGKIFARTERISSHKWL